MSNMSGKILVVGLQPYDAGKTTLCRALIHGFKEAGINLVPFKPHSGISYWNQFDSFERSAAEGTLLSSDIRELDAAAESQIPLEVLNPVNRLSVPWELNLSHYDYIERYVQFLSEHVTHGDTARRDRQNLHVSVSHT